MKNLICIVCPKGCHISVDEKNGFSVSGADCKRGEDYGKIEFTNPTRVITTTVAISSASEVRLPVKTDRPVKKSQIFSVMKATEDILVFSPIKVGDIIISNVANTGASLVATRNL